MSPEGGRRKVYVRTCPKCLKKVEHLAKSRRNSAARKGSWCRSCSGVRNGKANAGRTHSAATKAMYSRTRRGAGNAFYGKRHSEESKRLMSQKLRGGRIHSEEQKRRYSEAFSGSKNPRWGKSLLMIWTEKYGREEALRRDKHWRERMSAGRRGSANPMYGKPAPHGAGNGWSGWYKGWYFRSLRELTYVIEVLEERGFEWCSAERVDLTISYRGGDGSTRSYRADFLVSNRTLVEIKPKELQSLDENLRKRRAAKRFCERKGYRFRVYDIEPLRFARLRRLVRTGLVTLTARYHRKFEELVRARATRASQLSMP